MRVIHAVNLILLTLLQLAAQHGDGLACRSDLILCGFVDTLQGQEVTALLHIGQAQFSQHIQRCHGAAGNHIKAFTHTGLCDEFFSACGNSVYLQTQRITTVLNELDALGSAVQRSDVQLGLVAQQRHGGKTRTAADVQNPLAYIYAAFPQKHTVQHVASRNFLRLSNGRQVHHSILFNQQAGKRLHPLYGLGGSFNTPGGATVQYNASKVHTYTSLWER